MLKNILAIFVFLLIASALGTLLVGVFDITGPGMSLSLFIKILVRFLSASLILTFLVYLLWWKIPKKKPVFLPFIWRLRFKTKLAFAFSFMILIPAMLILFVSYNLLSRSINKWADEKVERALVESDKLTFTLERFYALPLSEIAKRIATDPKVIANIESKDHLEDAINLWLHDDQIVALYDSKGRRIFSNEQEVLPEELSDVIPLEELSKEPTTSEIDVGEGELFLCAVPIYKNKLKAGVAVAAKMLPFARANIEEGHKLYRLTALTRKEARKAVIAIFSLTGILILLVAFWAISLMTKAISGPIQALLSGTEEVAKGNLKHKVEVSTEDEFGQLAKSFNKMTYDLNQLTNELKRTEKIAVWQEVAQKLAHEIKNPLTPIQLSAQRLERKYRVDPERYDEILRQCTQLIVDEVENLRKLLDNFSTLARMPSPKPSEIQVNDLILKTLKLYGDQTDQLKFQLELDSNLPTLMVDEDQVKGAFFNLIKNAVEAMEGEGTLTIRSQLHQENFVSIQFQDTGPGLTSDALEKIFMPQFSTKQDGMGLGLAIVRKVVDDHGGEVKAENNPDKGAKFTIILPLK